MLISGFAFIGWVFFSGRLFPLWIFGKWDGCVLPVFLACLAGVFTGSTAGVGGWDTVMSWGKKGWRRWVFVIHWEWCQRGKGDCSRFPSKELGMRLGDLIS